MPHVVTLTKKGRSNGPGAPNDVCRRHNGCDRRTDPCRIERALHQRYIALHALSQLFKAQWIITDYSGYNSPIYVCGQNSPQAQLATGLILAQALVPLLGGGDPTIWLARSISLNRCGH